MYHVSQLLEEKRGYIDIFFCYKILERSDFIVVEFEQYRLEVNALRKDIDKLGVSL